MSLYNLKSLALPRLTGRPLQLFAAALENNAAKTPLLNKLLRDAGVIHLRDFHLDNPPVGAPFYYVDQPGGDVVLDYRSLSHDAGQRMIPDGIHFTTIRNYANAYREGATTPQEVAQRALQAIAASDKGDQPLRAFIATNEADLMAQAEASAQRWQAGKPLGIFDGVPIAVKDEIDQIPYPSTVGTRFLGQKPAKEDAAVVARLRAAGALLIGKANMYEIGIYPNSNNLHHGTVRNPYDLSREAGGSSSGSAAAVAAGICPAAIGADGGGSIRVPAALCGVVGLKPTYGRLSEHGAAPLCWSVAHLGPIGASVEDVALSYAVMAGWDAKDPNTHHQPAPTLGNWLIARLDGRYAPQIKIGIYSEWFRHADPEIVAACEAMVDKMVGYGAIVHEIEIPDLEEMRIAHSIAILSEMAASMARHEAAHQKEFAPPVRINLAVGRAATAYDYVQSQRMRARAMDNFARIFTDVDVILTPATGIVAPPILPESLSHGISDLSVAVELMRYMFPGNLTGLPAITFPVGYTKSGLPISMQAMGRPWEEHVLLRVAHAAESLMERQLPPLYYQLDRV